MSLAEKYHALFLNWLRETNDLDNIWKNHIDNWEDCVSSNIVYKPQDGGSIIEYISYEDDSCLCHRNGKLYTLFFKPE